MKVSRLKFTAFLRLVDRLMVHIVYPLRCFKGLQKSHLAYDRFRKYKIHSQLQCVLFKRPKSINRIYVRKLVENHQPNLDVLCLDQRFQPVKSLIEDIGGKTGQPSIF